MKYLILFSVVFFQFNLNAQTLAPDSERIDIWPSIPFTRGADLCQYRDAYEQTRSEYMRKMVEHASVLMMFGAGGRESLNMLAGFNDMYDRNITLATQQRYLDVTLESTLKSYISDYYRNLRPRKQKISFNNLNDLLKSARNPQNVKSITIDEFKRIEFFAYGTYSFAPNCKGDILVTLHLVGHNGDTKSYIGQGTPAVVMSQIASRIFEDFQRTRFPSEVKVGSNVLELVGGLNGSVDQSTSPKLAERACSTLDARLPSADELDLLDAYGDWSGGVSLNDKVWALADNKVFAPYLRNPSPIREVWEVNATEFMYYCVRVKQ